MKAITQFQSDDGTIFNTAEQAVERDVLVQKLAVIMSQLNPRPKGDMDFANGGGYIQQTAEALEKVKGQLLDLMAGHVDQDLIDETRDGKRHQSHIARYLDDGGQSPLLDAWYRLLFTDAKNREWGQMFYALNPTTGKQQEFKAA